MEPNKSEFKFELEKQWDAHFADICLNLRKIGLSVNDIEISAASIMSEVNSMDLIGISIIRRFEPTLYEMVYRNERFFTDTDDRLKSSHYLTAEERKAESITIMERVDSELAKTSDPVAFGSLLSHLFPKYRSQSKSKSYNPLFDTSSEDLRDGSIRKSICHPDYFPIYFRYEVPDTIVSAKDFAELMTKILSFSTRDERYQLLLEALNSLEKLSAKRFDLIHKIGVELETLPHTEAEEIAYVLSELASEYAYEIMNIGEAARALGAVFTVGQRIATTKKVTPFLANCLKLSTDDTFAVRLLSHTTTAQARNKILTNFENIDAEALRNAFSERMAIRYGYEVNAAEVNLTTGDPAAFSEWGGMGELQHAMSASFWERFVGDSRKKLATMVDFLFARFGWENDPTPFVNKVTSIRFLQHAFDSLPDDGVASKEEIAAVTWLSKLLKGEYHKGVPMYMDFDQPNS